jgi:uncharacterized radical SAM superfamily Fe-S cluster-containing enzyme
MDKPTLLRKLEAMLDEMKRERSFGQISIAFRDGEPDYLRKETTEKLTTNGAQGTTHAKSTNR